MMSTPSSTVLVARQVPSRLLHCGAKSAGWAPTWTLSTLSGWGIWKSLPSLFTLRRVGSMAGSSVGTSMKWLLLRHSPLHGGASRRSQSIKHRTPRLSLLGWWSHFLALLGLLDKGHGRACHSVSLPDGPNPVLQNLGFRAHDVRTLERGHPHSIQHLRLKAKVFEWGVLP